MTQLTIDQYRRRLESVAAHPAMAEDNIRLPEDAGRTISAGMLVVGAACLLVTIAGSLILGLKHALAAYEVGVFSVTAISLGGLFWVMVFRVTNSRWSATVRRLFEHLAMMLRVCVALIAVALVIELAAGGVMLSWLSIDPETNYLLEHKRGYLNPVFLVVRFGIIAGLWLLLATRLWRLSTEQDRTGDRMLTLRARGMSSWGMLVFALTTTFFAFDFLMSPDYRFFSTIWGVYYFASVAFSSLAVVLLTICILQAGGRLTGTITEEHVHDLGKLMFGFTVFWAYIAFSQYMLIWYGNIPEETAWFVHRKTGGWENAGALLAIGHFVIPFLLLLLRGVKRNVIGASLVGVWLLLMLLLDMIYILRPMVYLPGPDGQPTGPGAAGWWLDIAAIIGVLSIWGGLYVRRLATTSLVPLKDPRLPDALTHKNAV